MSLAMGTDLLFPLPPNQRKQIASLQGWRAPLCPDIRSEVNGALEKHEVASQGEQGNAPLRLEDPHW